MKFVTQWKLRSGKLAEAADRLLGSGDPKPEGLKTLGRWFRTDMQGGLSPL